MAYWESSTRNNYVLRLTMEAIARTQNDINNNQTRVSWKLELRTIWNAINARTVGSVTVGGSATSIPMQTRNHPSNNSIYLLASGTRTVKHNSNGVASCYGSAHYYSENQTASWRIPRLDINGTLTLSRIDQFPNAPGTPSASQGNLTVTVTSGTAGANGGTILGYEIRRRTNADGPDGAWTTSTADSNRRITFNPAHHGWTYSFQSRARTARGWGPWSGTRTLVTKTQIPSAPAAPTVTQGTVVLTATSAVASPNGQPVTSYEIRYRQYRNGAWSAWTTSTANSSRQITIASPTPGTQYEFQARANAGYGWGPWSASRTFTTKSQVPNAPSGAPSASQASGNGAVTLTSKTATVDGSPILGYEIEYRYFSGSSWSSWVRATAQGTSTPTITFTPTQHGTSFQARSRAVNEYNEGPWSTSLTFVTQPRAVVSSFSEVQPTSVRVSIAAVGGTEGGTQWTIQRATNPSFTANLIEVTTSDTVATFSGLTPGTTYYFRVRGANSGGTGAWSIPKTVQTPPSSPPVLQVTTAATGRSATASIVHAGMNVTRYYVEWAFSSNPSSILGSANGTNPNLTMGNLIPGTLYVARAWTTVGSYTSPKSAWVTFATPNPGAVTSAYFDGSSTDLADLDYQWNGTAHASYSKAVGKLPLRLDAPGSGAYTIPGSLFSGGGRLIRWVSVPEGGVGGTLLFRDSSGQRLSISEVVTYTFSLYIRAQQNSRVSLYIGFRDSPGAGVPLVEVAQPYDLVAGQSVRINVTGTSPYGATHAALNLSTLDQGTFDIDGVMFSPGGLIPYFDGDMTDTPTDTYTWLGTANDSISEHLSLPGQAVDYFEDPSCPRPPSPPRPPAIENTCIEEVSAWRRYWVHIQPSQLKAHIDALPTFTVRTGGVEESNVRIRIYPNPEGLPTNDFIPGAPLSEQLLVNLPPNAEVVLDALSERASGTVNGSPWQSVDHLVFGSDGRPPSYPVLSCGTPYLVAFDVPLESPAGNLTFEAELVERYG